MKPFKSWMFTPPMCGMDPLGICKMIGAFYECPRAPDGTRLGPLVGYAGTYGDGKQYVGDAYLNFAGVERLGPVLDHFVSCLADRLDQSEIEPDGTLVFCGAPEGGKALAKALSSHYGGEYIYPERVVLELATDHSREKSKLVFSRHTPREGDEVVIVEDVCNNFSTTAKLVELIESCGSKVVGIVCFLNRSMTTDDEFSPSEGRKLPIIALVRHPFDQYKQDDPFVQGDIAFGNIVWKPKNDWSPLARAMQKAAPVA